jgi:hypothetical protein
MIDAATLRSNLGGFNGTEEWFRHPLCRNVLYTEGVRYLAENADCYWLLDKIATLQMLPEIKALDGFQSWKLKVADSKAVLSCEDGNGNAAYSEDITFTDFPLDEINLWVEGEPRQPVILLPSEH